MQLHLSLLERQANKNTSATVCFNIYSIAIYLTNVIIANTAKAKSVENTCYYTKMIWPGNSTVCKFHAENVRFLFTPYSQNTSVDFINWRIPIWVSTINNY